jgi:hypothetical protein
MAQVRAMRERGLLGAGDAWLVEEVDKRARR